MAILKETTLPSFDVAAYHVVKKGSIDYETESLTVVVASWTDRDSCIRGDKPKMTAVNIDLAQVLDPEQALINKQDCAFFGGVIQTETSLPLEVARGVKWENIKRSREQDINRPLVMAYGVFQAGVEDRKNITDAILLANTLAALEQPVAIEWTLLDNSVITLDQTQLVQLGLALGARTQAAYSQARTLREQIDAAESQEDLDAIVWINT